ncbi:MAG: hypothetical protein LKI58_00060 [Actinomyces sp.]|nr:hypothetical protein [Actinomyces sp.]MCI1786452.1 hypothetical protein [Actinomyces sp.]
MTSLTPPVIGWSVVLGLGASWVATWLWSQASAHLTASILGLRATRRARAAAPAVTAGQSCDENPMVEGRA